PSTASRATVPSLANGVTSGTYMPCSISRVIFTRSRRCSAGYPAPDARSWLERLPLEPEPGPGEDVVEHPRGPPAGGGVLLARVVRAQDRATAGGHLEPVTETRARARRTGADRIDEPPRGFVRERTQRDHNPQSVEQLHLPDQERRAPVALRRCG